MREIGRGKVGLILIQQIVHLPEFSLHSRRSAACAATEARG